MLSTPVQGCAQRPAWSYEGDLSSLRSAFHGWWLLLQIKLFIFLPVVSAVWYRWRIPSTGRLHTCTCSPWPPRVPRAELGRSRLSGSQLIASLTLLRPTSQGGREVAIILKIYGKLYSMSLWALVGNKLSVTGSRWEQTIDGTEVQCALGSVTSGPGPGMKGFTACPSTNARLLLHLFHSRERLASGEACFSAGCF